MSGGQTVRTPWHLWVVGVVALLWNSFGCVDYFMTQTRQDEWFAQMGMTAAQVEYFNAMPMWTHGAWAIGVWGGVLGSLLLLLRNKLAFPVFAVSLGAFLISLLYTDAYADAAHFLALSAFALLAARFDLLTELLISLGDSRAIAFASTIRTLSLGLALPLGWYLGGVDGLILGSMLHSLAQAPFMLWKLKRHLPALHVTEDIAIVIAILAMVVVLGSEVWTLRERLAALEGGEAALAFVEKLDVPFYCFHDVDVMAGLRHWKDGFRA